MKNGKAEYECTCAEGYSGKECQINPCTPNPCDNGGICIINENKWTCSCPPGYNGKTCAGFTAFVALLFCDNPCLFCCLLFSRHLIRLIKKLPIKKGLSRKRTVLILYRESQPHIISYVT